MHVLICKYVSDLIVLSLTSMGILICLELGMGMSVYRIWVCISESSWPNGRYLIFSFLVWDRCPAGINQRSSIDFHGDLHPWSIQPKFRFSYGSECQSHARALIFQLQLAALPSPACSHALRLGYLESTPMLNIESMFIVIHL